MRIDMTDHVRHDRAHCMCTGLFRPLRRGERKKAKLDITYDYGDSEEWHFWGPEPLGADDMRVLQGIVSLTGPNGLVLKPTPKSEKGKKLRHRLEPKWEALSCDASVVETSFYKLLKVCGWKNATMKRRQVLKSLKRMGAVTVYLSFRKRCWSMHLLSYDVNEETGKVGVALNWRLAAVVFGLELPCAIISLVEARQLKSDPTRILHQWLSAYVSPGKSQMVRLLKLIPHVWPEECDSRTSALRKRRKSILESLNEIGSLPAWNIQIDKGGMVYIERSRKLPRMLEDEVKQKWS